MLPDLLDDLIRVSIAARLPDLADLSSLAAASRRMRALLLTRVQRGHAVHRTSLERLAENLRALVTRENLTTSQSQLAHAEIAAIAEALRGNGVLTKLNLARKNIRDEGATAIAEALRGNGVLKTLYLRENRIGPKGGVAIGEAQILQVLRVIDNKKLLVLFLLALKRFCKNLNLYYNNIGDTGAIAIAEALRGNGVLTNLDLFRNVIGPEGAVAIADALSARQRWKRITDRWEKADTRQADEAELIEAS
ncbi:hypothetical protein EMIHUDRAFT_196324 [Emiliania huxleyi CCMP1516]|uniref:F-box domain-containing protein n=2 Tax=Emiliania huxleyi TaxID=2903 RepID=A0A0D3J3W3_EMIH1|nr:hypothetical protein EMIHUDRAFT_196324 [Emiliania huxleyi CCMP1516]EOD18198.1 hypothetical protein EMIHUDRAFT_196324 [Emiliania huxleyi CCMP1516]|eukprot:XP_005770627.1 hypothetical protein EMIHUDRAFT_196324 [Emiliania huxleyi CCMP1516]